MVSRRPRKRVPKRRVGGRPTRLAQQPRRVVGPQQTPLHNLPTHLSTFIGREREIAEVTRLLSEVHLLTLTGPGGCGKSRLALQAASGLLQDYADGIWLAQLAPVSDPAFVPQTIAAALRVSEQLGRPVTETLVHALRFKSLLLVMDNCEHLLSPCAELADALLQTCSGLRVLATSQEPLSVPGETVWHVPSLSMPGEGPVPPIDRLMSYEAVRLFIERAASAQPEFTLTDSTAAVVAQVCRQLDGIPLAIELAAARVKALAVEQIASRLDDRFQLLTGGGRRSLPRHRTLRAAMDWSYGLLSAEERVVLQRLSTFAGGWTLEAAEAVCSGSGVEAADILNLLTQLIDKSLVVVETQGGEARHRLLETVRQYSLDRLMESEAAVDVRRRHRDWYLGLAERAEQELQGPAQVVWLERVEREHDNLRAALEWSRSEEGGTETALRLTGALYWFWFLRGHWSDGRQWLEVALARSRDTPSFALSKIFRGAAHLAWRQGDYGRATALCQEGLVICRDVGDQEGNARLLSFLGTLMVFAGDYVRATGPLNESLGLCEVLGNKWIGSANYVWLAVAARYQNDYASATAFAEKSLAYAKDSGDRWRIARALRILGILALHQGDFERAAGCHKESLILSREMGDRLGVQEGLEGLAGVVTARGNYEQAARLFGAAEALRIALGLHRPPLDQTEYARRVASTRTALKPAGFAAAWAHGAEMTPEQAIEYALTAAEPVPRKGTTRLAGDTRSTSLTLREREVAGLIAQGLSNREIAAHLVITQRTAESHVQHILDKLGFASRGRVAAWATEQGLHTSPRP